MRKRRKKWVPYALLGAVGAGVCLFLFVALQTIARTPLAVAGQKSVVYPVQYSDTHITKNAVTTDRTFNDPATFNTESFLAAAAGSLEEPIKASAVTGPEKGTWLWTPTLDITPAYRDSIIAGAKKNGIRNIYLSIDSYLDIYVMPDGPEKKKKEKLFDGILESFIAAARRNDMTVDAEAGWRNWAEPGNEYKAFAVLKYAIQFNATHTEKLRGFQYDIEPYLLADYAKNKRAVLHDFVDLISETVSRLRGSDLVFSVVIPDFYDGTSGETPRFFYGWRYAYTLTHLLTVLERRPGSQLLVMAYRNRSDGTDGSIAISEDEVDAANGSKTKVVVAQETGEVSPPYLTFYNSSLSSLNEQVQNIEEAFADETSYNGIAVHYINALMNLE